MGSPGEVMHGGPSSVALRILESRDDIAGLRAINTSILKTGAAIYIASAQTLFILDRDSNEAPVGTAVVAPVNGPGRWLGQQIGFGLDVLTQTAWAIDFIAGDDSAEGTPSAPLKTGAEWTRRTYGRGLNQFTTLQLLNDCPDPTSDYLVINSPVLSTAGFLRIVGGGVTLASGTLTAVANQVTNTSQTTVETSVDLSNFVGQRLRIVLSSTAPVGTVCYIEAAQNGTYTLSTPNFTDTSVPGSWNTSTVRTLSVGDSFVVERLFQAPAISVNAFGMGNSIQTPYARSVGVADLAIGASSGFDDISLGTNGRVVAWGCQMQMGTLACALNGPLTSINASRFSNTYSVVGIEGSPAFNACSFSGSVNSLYPTTWLAFLTGNSIRGGRIQLDHSGRAQINGLTIQEWPVLSGIGAALFVQEGCFVNLGGRLWGTSSIANTYGIRVDAYGGVVYAAGGKPTISGTLSPGKDVEVGGVALPYADVPGLSANAANFAAIVAKNA